MTEYKLEIEKFKSGELFEHIVITEVNNNQYHDKDNLNYIEIIENKSHISNLYNFFEKTCLMLFDDDYMNVYKNFRNRIKFSSEILKITYNDKNNKYTSGTTPIELFDKFVDYINVLLSLENQAYIDIKGSGLNMIKTDVKIHYKNPIGHIHTRIL